MALVKRRGGQIAGGGNWKLALADLKIALMCCFITFWILEFKDSIDREDLVSVMDVEASIANSITSIDLEAIATTNTKNQQRYIDDSSVLAGEYNTQQQLEVLAKTVEESLGEMGTSDAIDIQVTPEGLRLTLRDGEHGQMFETGRSRLTPYYEDLLLGLGPVLASVRNGITVSGHTDGSRFIGARRTNWELSTERANTARYYLNRSGVSSRNIVQVNGYADTMLVNRAEPRAAENRRIEIFILTREARERQFRMFDVADGRVQDLTQEDVADLTSAAFTTANDNRPVSTFDAMRRAASVGNE
ncbi:OmpA family protein [Vibrio breoganii]|uniref:OmpA family protein n=1 Tax=Vibrio breoganii TaxID=553239 RepID=UPI000C8676DE|nr:OmpA family protein [Vibrio breoganii]PML12756.1 hypothetical protein BCT84_02405 [Vibrio breoganii]